ncbi:hypothetical protein ERJ75_000721100 [Trypanosoma vivax]|uniref:Uncharacterized protein n=1 Tax=Trypanosoma vivax (strain Y486) TaxID=1055687 RepID=G0TWV1_TRYVY|nr:hypothetical protein TRVL_00231 [Trypanosoma vivax]KAH8614291.1 hypothetical protein ERJ75_000721100 [Trypanosoma vivax]CCC48439.1 conserved hypothetical protein [Trypanosoma vivax Y486]
MSNRGDSGCVRLRQPSNKSSRGGYLCSPFTLKPAFAAMAEHHVECVVRGGNDTCRVVSRGTTGDNEDTDEGFSSRPWFRAGVGASALSAKERQQQQEEVEKIYGVAFEDVASLASPYHTEPSENCDQSGSLGSWIGLGVGLSEWERSALQRVVPRAVRRSATHQEDKNCPKIIGHTSLLAEDANPSLAGRKRSAEEHPHPQQKVDQKRCAPEGCIHKTADVGRHQFEVRKPLNRLQKLDELRNAALFCKRGKKRI